ncbi:hypothetical protein CPB85DRAFT_256733 [Mucidula mucida]|nr:hypothetical protein CPB85DRAFT_256733 [Mucidula mucida]
MSSPAPPPNVNAFPADTLKTYIKKLLESNLAPPAPSSGSSQVKAPHPSPAQMQEIRTRVKERMCEIRERGFKYIVLTHLAENRGQGTRADISCHWEDADVVVQEVYVNDAIICVCIAFAVRVA